MSEQTRICKHCGKDVTEDVKCRVCFTSVKTTFKCMYCDKMTCGADKCFNIATTQCTTCLRDQEEEEQAQKFEQAAHPWNCKYCGVSLYDNYAKDCPQCETQQCHKCYKSEQCSSCRTYGCNRCIFLGGMCAYCRKRKEDDDRRPSGLF